MGWFWADQGVGTTASEQRKPFSITPPSACPMEKSSSSTALLPRHLSSSTSRDPHDLSRNHARTFTTFEASNSCPYMAPEAKTPSATQRPSPPSTIAALNPLNNMPSNLSQDRESDTQTVPLPVERQTSSIPRGGAGTTTGNWVYPSPQQMYNAMLRKGYTDTPQDAIESMVAVHNFLNEGAWAEILEWERRFGQGLARGWQESSRGEEGSRVGAMLLPSKNDDLPQPKLLRFMGRADAVTPKAHMMQVLGWIYPSMYSSMRPFDRHDWYVERRTPDGKSKEVRYVIDYYAGPPEPTGEPVFYLDIRPALDRPSAAAERLVRWGRDFWWRASGARERE